MSREENNIFGLSIVFCSVSGSRILRVCFHSGVVVKNFLKFCYLSVRCQCRRVRFVVRICDYVLLTLNYLYCSKG